jgi:hypothetical protein
MAGIIQRPAAFRKISSRPVLPNDAALVEIDVIALQ